VECGTNWLAKREVAMMNQFIMQNVKVIIWIDQIIYAGKQQKSLVGKFAKSANA
jgi:hypothetical protein